MKYSSEVINTCLAVLNRMSVSGETLYQALESRKADGLTLYECELICSALDNYLSGATTHFVSGNKKDTNDTTPYDLVQIIKAYNEKSNIYRQRTCIERFGDAENEKAFYDLYECILEGEPQSVVREMVGWSQSDLEPISYEKITDSAKKDNERIVFDNMQYILCANPSIIVLYEKVDSSK